MTAIIEHERSVYSRYASAARQAENALCCAVKYDKNLLAAIPDEIIERDYGCGDPTPYVRPGDTVLDLGSGGGKVCYIAAQIVGPTGRVIGVDCNDEMLALARRHRGEVARRLGYDVVDFRRGLIQDLRLDLDLLAAELAARPVDSPSRWLEMRSFEEVLRRERPMVPDKTVDCVVSNCVLNLVRLDNRTQLLGEVFRVLKEGGRAAICDIVSDRDVPERLRQDMQLWSGCLSGAFREDRFLAAFEQAGFHGIQIADRQREPWQTIEGIEFRSLTVLAHKGEQEPSRDCSRTVVYRGPFKRVEADDGGVYQRGQPVQVGESTVRLLSHEPYAGQFLETGSRLTAPPEGSCPGGGDSTSCCGPLA